MHKALEMIRAGILCEPEENFTQTLKEYPQPKQSEKKYLIQH